MANSEIRSLTIEVSGLEDLNRVATEIVSFANQYKVWTLEGEMGAGKTTITKALGEVFGIVDTVNSPTFSIVNEYRDEQHQVYYHFDFYRIKNEAEAQDIGVDEYFYSGDYCFIEWPSLIPSLLPDSHLRLEIEILDENKRRINCTKHD